MSRVISEADWRVFRQLQPLALERFCERVLSEVGRVAADDEKTSHQRYLELFQLVQRRDKELAEAFDGPRRSTAFFQLARLQAHGLLSEAEMSRFTDETREVVRLLAGVSQD